jgi:hydroxypyruvate isomerase
MNRRQFTQNLMGAAAAMGSGLALPEMKAMAQGPASGVTFHFSVMLWTLNKVQPVFEKQLEMVAAAGYTGVELVGEWHKWTDDDFTKYRAKLKELGLKVDSMAGIAGTFADPAGGDALVAGTRAAIVAADKIGCPQLLYTSGKRQPGTTMDTVIANLKRVMEEADKAGKEVVIEPIDLLENPAAWLTSVTQAFEICRAIGNPKLKVLYDVYHEQRQAGNLVEKFQKNIDLVGLIHIADVPGRHEPGTGEIRYDAIYKVLGQLKYSGYMAMEFYSTGDAVATLRAAREEAIRAATSV